MTHLLLTVRFLDDRYHGLLDRNGPPEWPPSPYRLFQALVAGVARRGELVVGPDVPDNRNFTEVGLAISRLQRLDPPLIITPRSKRGQAIIRFVPNNDGDKKFDRQERLTAKRTIPTLFLLDPDQRPEVHYVWDISGHPDLPIERIRDAARSLTSLGWGIDMAFADADIADLARLEALKGVRWHPKTGAWRNDGMLRTPTYDDQSGECTLCDLRHCHHTAMNRIQQGQPLKTVDKPKVFGRVLYTSTERPTGRPYAVFRMLDENDDAWRYPHAKLMHVAGMVRHAAIERMKEDPPNRSDAAEWIEHFVCGHRDGAELHEQISYVPLPSIGHEHADALIRNVMLIAPLGRERDLEYVAERLDGEVLTPERRANSIGPAKEILIDEPIFLSRFTPPSGRFIQTRYLGTSAAWQSVTPVILDGHNKKTPSAKREAIERNTAILIGKALRRAGIETPCKFTWRSLPYFKNCLTSHKYDRSNRSPTYFRAAHLKEFTAVHVRLEFEHPVQGPITIGAGRHCGFGLMAVAE